MLHGFACLISFIRVSAIRRSRGGVLGDFFLAATQRNLARSPNVLAHDYAMFSERVQRCIKVTGLISPEFRPYDCAFNGEATQYEVHGMAKACQLQNQSVIVINCFQVLYQSHGMVLLTQTHCGLNSKLKIRDAINKKPHGVRCFKAAQQGPLMKAVVFLDHFTESRDVEKPIFQRKIKKLGIFSRFRQILHGLHTLEIWRQLVPFSCNLTHRISIGYISLVTKVMESKDSLDQRKTAPVS
jgi:hypothetical protein